MNKHKLAYGETEYPKTKKAQQRLFDDILQAGRAGKSHAQIVEMIGIGRDTLKEWVEQQSDLARVIKLADDFALAWWEALGQRQAETREGNSTVFIFVMKNRFGVDYSKDSKILGEEARAAEKSGITDTLAALSPKTRNALRDLLRDEPNTNQIQD